MPIAKTEGHLKYDILRNHLRRMLAEGKLEDYSEELEHILDSVREKPRAELEKQLAHAVTHRKYVKSIHEDTNA